MHLVLERKIILLYFSDAIIIGINDLVKDGVWTSFDGIPVGTFNLPWKQDQPNGGRKENCVVVQADLHKGPLTLRDRECSNSYQRFLCYKDGNTLSKISSRIFDVIFVKKKFNELFGFFFSASIPLT